jgi:hypothetical protein
MQTFLTSASFQATAHHLDRKRLGRQRVEAKQILNALQGKSKGWRNHPATLMWHGYEEALMYYHDCMVREWTARGYRNTMPLFFPKGEVLFSSQYPPWWHDNSILNKIIESHKSNLYRKDPVYYSHYKEYGDSLPYYWPVTKESIELRKVLEFCA